MLSHVMIGSLPGDGYRLDFSHINVASLGLDTDVDKNFIGHMQNFIFDKYNFFELLADPRFGIKWPGGTPTERETIMPVNVVTFRWVGSLGVRRVHSLFTVECWFMVSLFYV